MKYPIIGLTILQNFGRLKNSKKILDTNTNTTTTTISIKKSKKITKPKNKQALKQRRHSGKTKLQKSKRA
jgi:hypothetical protein